MNDLQNTLDRYAAFCHAMANRYLPNGFFVSYGTRANTSTLAELRALRDANKGKQIVWGGASAHTIFRNPAANYAFRAWHDYYHLTMNQEFTEAGENRVMAFQIRDVREHAPACDVDAFSRILECEIMGQFAYKAEFGTFPANQLEFARGWLLSR